MSLRTRFTLSVAIWLLVSLTALGVMELQRSRAAIDAQMNQSFSSSTRFWRSLRLDPGPRLMPYLNRLVRMFDNNHHFKVTLKAGDREILSSHPALTPLAPQWYAALMDVPIETRVAVDLKSSGQIVLISGEPQMEIYQAWTEFRDGALVLGLSSLILLLVLDQTVKHITESLRRLKAGFEAVGGGNYETAITLKGPSDIVSMAKSFNRMTMQLKQLATANAKLSLQLTNIQEEERAELARDLHDETSPLLFSMRLDAEALRTELQKTGHPRLAERAFILTEAVGEVQHHIRAILKRLRSDSLAETGLKLAINNLVLFWNRHQADLEIHLEMRTEGFDAEVNDAIYRVVQESLTNVARHSGATQVWIAVKSEDDAITAEVEDNGIGGVRWASEGLGLKGMRERMAMLGGHLAVEERPTGGTRLVASIPLHKVCEMA